MDVNLIDMDLQWVRKLLGYCLYCIVIMSNDCNYCLANNVCALPENCNTHWRHVCILLKVNFTT